MTTNDAAVVAAIPAIQHGRSCASLSEMEMSARHVANALASTSITTDTLAEALGQTLKSLGTYMPADVDGHNVIQIDAPTAETRICNAFRDGINGRISTDNVNKIVEAAHAIARLPETPITKFNTIDINILSAASLADNEYIQKNDAAKALERALALREPDAKEADEIEANTIGAKSGRPHARMDFAIGKYMPLGCVTLFYGSGGLFKSTLMMQAAIAVATGTSWHGNAAMQGAVVTYFAEDPIDEVRSRANRHCLTNEIDERGLTNVYMSDIFESDDDPTLVHKDGNHTIAYAKLWRMCEHAKKKNGNVRLIIVDNAALVFCGGNQNDRSEVMRFTKKLQKLATKFKAAVLLLHHVSKGGVDRGASGSTAWTNAARSAMSVDIDGNGAELSVEDEDGNIAFSQRIAVAHRKSNYAPRQPILNLELPVPPPSPRP